MLQGNICSKCTESWQGPALQQETLLASFKICDNGSLLRVELPPLPGDSLDVVRLPAVGAQRRAAVLGCIFRDSPEAPETDCIVALAKPIRKEIVGGIQLLCAEWAALIQHCLLGESENLFMPKL